MRFSHTLSTCKRYVSVSIVVLAMTLFLAGCPSPNDPAPNNGSPTVSIAVDRKSISEVAGSAMVTLTRSQDEVRDPLTVQLTIEGDATIDEDYTGLSNVNVENEIVTATVTIPEGKNEVIFTITAVNDGAPDNGEEVVITIKESGDYTIGDPSTATLTIVDPAPSDVPVVSISTSDENNAVNEGGSISVTINSNQPVTDNLEVSLIIGGTATRDTDYTGLSNVNVENEIVTATVTIPGGDTKAMVTIEAINDSIHELAEDLTITIDSATRDYSVLTSSVTATVTITDDDLPTVSIGSSVSIQEGSDATLTLTRSNDEVRDPLTVQLTIEGDATIDEDYELSDVTTNTSGDTVTIPEGKNEVIFTITAMNDDVPDTGEEVVITIKESGDYTIGDPSTATLTIVDPAPSDVPVVSIITSDTSNAVNEDESISVTISSKEQVPNNLEVSLIIGGTATINEDYALPGVTTTTLDDTVTATVTIPRDTTTVTFTINAINDSIHEPAEDLTITIDSATKNYSVPPGGNSVTVTINDDIDDLPTVGFSATSQTQTLDEGDDEGVTVILERSNDEVRDSLTVKLKIEGGAEKGKDYETLSDTVTFKNGEDTATITLTVIQDDIHEAAKTVVITIIDEPSSTYRIKKGEETATITINDDDLPTVGIAVNRDEISESSADGEVEVTLTRSNDEVRASLTVELSFAESTANEGEDYEVITPFVTIGSGEDATDFTLQLRDDGDVEGNEEVIITILEMLNAYTIDGDKNEVTITIIDDGNSDGDSTDDSFDVDDDNNGLIEIRNLDMLRNVHFNLAGTSYKDGSSNEGDTNGGPDSETDHCKTRMNEVFLCGYELTGNLDFSDAGSYATGIIKDEWRPNVADDSNNSTNAGFPGIGAATGSGGFNAIFEGNGHSILNLYMRTTTTDNYNTGLFRRTDTGAKIRNLGMMNVAIYGGAGNNDQVGGLVGLNFYGTITASYATGDVDGGDGATDYVGGLVGFNYGPITASYASGTVDGGAGTGDRVGGLVGQNYGPITASYATGDIDGGAGNDDVGGLVGSNSGGGTITASYATGTVNGGAGNNDYVGGLVGFNYSGTITASYATGDVDGGGAGNNVGGLVGYNGGTITASYGFGTLSGENVNSDDTQKPANVNEASDLTKDNAGTEWNSAGSNTLDAWDFGDTSQNPALKYADYDGPGDDTYSCDLFPACGSLLPGQVR